MSERESRRSLLLLPLLLSPLLHADGAARDRGSVDEPTALTSAGLQPTEAAGFLSFLRDQTSDARLQLPRACHPGGARDILPRRVRPWPHL